MGKKRLFKLSLSVFALLGTLTLANVSKNDKTIVNAADEELVGTPTIGWNNVDYSINSGMHWAPDTTTNGVPQSGYVLLALYSTNISAQQHFDENLITSNLPGCNVSDYVLLNGVKSSEVEGAIIYAYPENGIFIYMPNNSLTFNDQYEYATVEILEGMSIDGSAQTVATRFEYRGLLGSFGEWQVNPAPIEKKSSTFEKIDWNNRDYSATMGQQWSGELNANGAPIDGYCMLAFFKEEGKTLEETVLGTITTNGRGVIGIGLNADYKIKVNGVNIIDVEGAKCFLFPQYGLYFYLPHDSLTFNEQYEIPTISIEEGLHFNNVYLPKITFEFRGELGTAGVWTYSRDLSDYQKFTFNEVPDAWNNVALDSTHRQTILTFGQPDVDFLKENHVADGTNLSNKYSEIGKNITVNGVQLYKYPDAIVSYLHGKSYVYIVLPLEALKPTAEYKVTTLYIPEDTPFYDTLLNEVTLYLFNDKWVTSKPETPKDEDYIGTLSFQDVFDKETATINETNPLLSSSHAGDISSYKFFMDYKLLNQGSAAVLFILGSENQNGLRIVLRENTVSLYDATNGSILLGTAALGNFNYDEWYSLFVYSELVDNKLCLMVAIDDITYIHATNVKLTNKNKLGSLYNFYLGDGEVSFKNATLRADNKKPILSYSGKSVYSVLAGSNVMEFTNKVSAYDVNDGDVTSKITYSWQEGAISHNTINKGTWKVTITAFDNSNNSTSLVVTIIATDKLEVTVTFDGSNPVTYRVGDYIACIENPVKESNGNISYQFVGWYYNGRLWDFENDYVYEDMNLESRFHEVVDQCSVTFLVEGLKDSSSYVLYFANGTELNLDTFAKEGYTLKAYINEQEVTSIAVNGNTVVRLVYTSSNPQKSSGCKGNLSSMAILVTLLSGVALILLVSFKKKGGKRYE